MDTWSAVVGVMRSPVNLANPGKQLGAALCGGAGRSSAPSVVAAAADLQHAALDADGPEHAMVVDEAVSHGDSFAKKAVAFFKMSRSMVRRRFSSRSRRSSACTAEALSGWVAPGSVANRLSQL